MIIDDSSATEGISLEEVARHLRIYDASEQAVPLADTLAAARDLAERHSARTFRNNVTRTEWYDQFPSGPVALSFPPVASVTSVQYYPSDGGALATVSSSEYRLDAPTENKAYLCWDDNFSTPTIDTRPDAVQITFVTGGAIPPAAKHAILMLSELFWGDDGLPLAHLRQAALDSRAKSLLNYLSAHYYV